MKKTSVSAKKRCESKLWLSGRQRFNMVYLTPPWGFDI